ncbi:MAG TPA: hypothetical protein VIZ65_14545 [Cellvibrionaceae bacterium]
MLRLILPIFFPSWRFFNSIGPSPRLMVQIDAGAWEEFCAKPVKLNMLKRLGQLFYNPCGNQILFVQSCAARLFDEQGSDTVEIIFLAIAQAIALGQLQAPNEGSSLCWRVEELNWQTQGKITASIIYTSDIRSVATLRLLWRADSKLCR